MASVAVAVTPAVTCVSVFPVEGVIETPCIIFDNRPLMWLKAFTVGVISDAAKTATPSSI